jgi:hypothetical protein
MAPDGAACVTRTRIRLAVLLVAYRFPTCALLAPCHPGAARRDSRHRSGTGCWRARAEATSGASGSLSVALRVGHGVGAPFRLHARPTTKASGTETPTHRATRYNITPTAPPLQLRPPAVVARRGTQQHVSDRESRNRREAYVVETKPHGAWPTRPLQPGADAKCARRHKQVASWTEVECSGFTRWQRRSGWRRRTVRPATSHGAGVPRSMRLESRQPEWSRCDPLLSWSADLSALGTSVT